MDVIIYHNPACGTSRNTLGLIRNAGIEPHVIEYLKTPPSRAMLEDLIARMGVARARGDPGEGHALRRARPRDPQHHGRASCSTPCWRTRPDQSADRGDAARRADCAGRPRRCSTSCPPQQAPFSKEDGEPVIDEGGRPRSREGVSLLAPAPSLSHGRMREQAVAPNPSLWPRVSPPHAHGAGRLPWGCWRRCRAPSSSRGAR